MWQEQMEEPVQLNWTAILSFTGSIACSLAIWMGLFQVIRHFVN